MNIELTVGADVFEVTADVDFDGNVEVVCVERLTDGPSVEVTGDALTAFLAAHTTEIEAIVAAKLEDRDVNRHADR